MTLANKNKKHQAGVLLHISSLPTGDLGSDAYRFVDFLASTGATVWQTLPINMPHADNSPYQCISAHAANPAFISLQLLVEDGLISDDDVALGHQALNVAYHHFLAKDELSQFNQFCKLHKHWLEDFALYLVLRQSFNFAGWNAWPEQYKQRDKTALSVFKKEYATTIEQVKFHQYLFFQQWEALKAYANSKNVALFGDIPIFVAYDSAEVWAKPNLFKLDENKEMTVAAGVPPDYFSETGQRWGNPHYNWAEMAKDDYAWWVDRMRTQSRLFDLVRIDHFRGLESAWEIPASEETAMNGTWVLAPGDDLLAAIYKKLPKIHLVAEDLGIITPEVDALRLKYDMPGMKILQFAFGGDKTNPYLPENIEENSVVYTGTHDNDTTLSWYQKLEPHVKEDLNQYLQSEQPNMPFALVQLALSCAAYLVIVPMQDVLELDGDHRMNTPGTIVGNWSWKFEWEQLSEQQSQQFANVIKATGR
ncbi:MAG: 4-alpha-glucanotransferase [Methylophilus sp.]|jgi:4-alpha-glucanotransferase